MQVEELAYVLEAGGVIHHEVTDSRTLVLKLKNHQVTVVVTDIEELDIHGDR